ncbi:hypothetical protein FQZ97_916070 [compost metagenome]
MSGCLDRHLQASARRFDANLAKAAGAYAGTQRGTAVRLPAQLRTLANIDVHAVMGHIEIARRARALRNPLDLAKAAAADHLPRSGRQRAAPATAGKGYVEHRHRHALLHLHADFPAEHLTVGGLPGAAHDHAEADDASRHDELAAQLRQLRVCQFDGLEQLALHGEGRYQQACDQPLPHLHNILPAHPARIRRSHSG